MNITVIVDENAITESTLLSRDDSIDLKIISDVSHNLLGGYYKLNVLICSEQWVVF